MFKQALFSVTAAACLAIAPMAVADSLAVADSALSGWVNAVLSKNPALQAAQAEVAAAAARVRAADQPLFNPELEFDHETSEIDTTSGGFSQSIDWADKRGARTAVAASEQVAAYAGLRATRQELVTGLLRALANWHTAAAVARVSERQAALMSRFARLAEQRRKAGDLGQVELDLAHLAAAEAAFRQANADETLVLSRQAVGVLAGSAAPDWPEFTRQLPDIEPAQVDVDRLLAHLPAVQAAQARVAAGRAAVRLSVRERRPDPTVGFRVGKEDSDTLTGISLSVPLFVRNSYRAEVEVANAELVQAGRELADLRRQAAAGLGAAAEVYRNARRAWEAWNAAGAPRLSQRTDLLDRLWQAGELDTTDYLVQLKQALDTEISAIEQRGRMWVAWADWLAASGQADQWLNLAGDTP